MCIAMSEFTLNVCIFGSYISSSDCTRCKITLPADLRPRHWNEIGQALGVGPLPLDSNEVLLGQLVEQGLAQHAAAVAGVSETASREAAIERQLEDMMQDWRPLRFILVPFKATGGRRTPAAARTRGTWSLQLSSLATLQVGGSASRTIVVALLH